MTPLTKRYRADIRREVYEVFLEANRGIFPRSEAHWERVARRLGVRILMHEAVTEPHVRYNCFLSRGVLYLPPTDNYALFHLWCLHELAEIALLWEGRPPCHYPPSWGDHHDLALIVDGRA